MYFRYFKNPKPRFFGHRGAAGKAPENTQISFQIASQSTRYIETDTWLTKDEIPVLFHDESLLRTCGVDQKISELSWDELQAFDAGHTFSMDGKSFPYRGQEIRIPKLEDMLQNFPEHFFNIEIKDSHPKAVSKVLEALKANNALDRTLLAAEKDEIMLNIRKEKPQNLPTSACYGEVFRFLEWLQTGMAPNAFTCEAQAFQIPHEWQGQDLAKPEMIAVLHQLGIEVHYWTINDVDLIKKLLAAGADGIVTDFPEFARGF